MAGLMRGQGSEGRALRALRTRALGAALAFCLALCGVPAAPACAAEPAAGRDAAANLADGKAFGAGALPGVQIRDDVVLEGARDGARGGSASGAGAGSASGADADAGSASDGAGADGASPGSAPAQGVLAAVAAESRVAADVPLAPDDPPAAIGTIARDGFLYALNADGATATLVGWAEPAPPARAAIPAAVESGADAYRVTALGIGGGGLRGAPLETLELPASIEAVDARVFAGCDALREITVAEGNAAYGARGGMLCSKDGAALAACPPGVGETARIPASATTIEAHAFAGCAKLKTVQAPGLVEAIEAEAFPPEVLEAAVVELPAAGDRETQARAWKEAGFTRFADLPAADEPADEPDDPGDAAEPPADEPSGTPSPDPAAPAPDEIDAALLPVRVFASLASAPVTTPRAARAVITFIVDNIKYSTAEAPAGEVFISGSSNGGNQGPSGDVVVPFQVTYGGATYEVTGLDNYAFLGNEKITSVKVTNPKFRRLGTSAFGDCTALRFVDLSVADDEKISSHAMWSFYPFEDCSSLQEVIFGPGLVKLSDSMFSRVTHNFTITALGSHWDFESSIKGWSPSTVTVQMPGGVVNGATYEERVAQWRAAGFSKFVMMSEDDPALGLTFSKVSDTELSVWATDPATIEVAAIPATHSFGGVDGFAVTVIEQDAFRNAKNLRSVTVPESVREMRSGAFEGCDNAGLTSIALPSTLQSIGARAFQGCTALASATVAEPAALQTIGDSAFEGSGLRAFQIPSSVTAIGVRAFANCAELASVNLDMDNSQLVSYGTSCYEGCVKLQALAFSQHLTAIPDSFAKGCASLASVYSNNAVATVGASAFEGCVQLKSAPLSSVTTTIGAAAFSGCAAMAAPSLPDGLTSIGERAFEGCRAFDKVSVPNSVTSLGVGAFKGCDRLESVKLGGSIMAPGAKEGVAVVPASFFQGCAALSKLTCYGDVATVDKTALEGVDTSRMEVYLCGRGVSYAASAEELARWKGVWSGWTFAVLSPYAFVNDVNGAPHDNKFSTLEAGCRVYIGPSKAWEGHVFGGWYSDKDVWEDLWPNNDSGLDPHVMPAHDVTLYARWFASGAQVTDFPFTYTLISGGSLEVSLAPGAESVSALRVPATHAFDLAGEFPVTRVADGGFEGASGLRSITLPDSITEVGARAFAGCTALAGVSLPASVASVGERAFAGCMALAAAEFAAPSKLAALGASAFENCSALTEIALPKGLSGVPDAAFSGCGSLAKVTFAADAACASIGDWAFYGCAVRAVRFPDALASVGSYAFAGCPNLGAVELPDSVAAMGEGAFSLSRAIKVATLGAGITAVPTNAFYGCPLATIYAAGDVASINKANSFTPDIKETAYVVLPDTADFDVRAQVWREAGFKNVGRAQASYTTTFHANYPGAADPWASAQAALGQALAEPDEPTREGYAFTGWYRDATATARWDFAVDVTPPYDLDLHAGWAPVNPVRVTVPIAAPVVSIDAAGDVTAETGERAFRIESTSLQDVRIASITCAAKPDALARLFFSGADGARLTFTARGTAASTASLPLANGAWNCLPGYAPDFVLPAPASGGTTVLHADFGLDLPADARLAFLGDAPLDLAEVVFAFEAV